MNPDQPNNDNPMDTYEAAKGKFMSAVEAFDSWIEEQAANKRAGRVAINLEVVRDIVFDLSTNAQKLIVVETEEEKRDLLSQIQEAVEKALRILGTITDLYNQVEEYVAAKRLLLKAREGIKEFEKPKE
jgi:DNA-binding transcriptional regulator GbsR (MarR family)